MVNRKSEQMNRQRMLEINRQRFIRIAAAEVLCPFVNDVDGRVRVLE